MKLTFLAVPALVVAMLAGCSGGGVPSSVTAPGPNAGDTAAAAAIPSCGEDSMLLGRDSSTGSASDVTTVYDTALAAIEPVCGQEWAKSSSGKQEWVYYYAGGEDVADQLITAFKKNEWKGDASAGYLNLVEQSGNNRSAHVYVVSAASAQADTMAQTYFLGIPDELVGKDLTVVQVG